MQDPTTGHFVYEQLFVAIPGSYEFSAGFVDAGADTFPADTRAPNYYRHNINTTTVIPSQEKALDRLRFWNRSKAA